MTSAIAAAMAALALLGVAVGWWLGRRSTTGPAQTELARATADLRERKLEIDQMRAERDTLLADRAAFQTQADELRRLSAQQDQELAALRKENATLGSRNATLETQFQAAQSAIASERELLTQAREKLTDTFKSLAGDILKENNREFLGIATRQFTEKETAIQNLLTPVRETLGKMEAQTQHLETQRAQAYTEVLTEIRNIQKTHETLRQETTQLVQALRAPKARGNWGELQLKRCIEFSGMVEHCSFDTEVFLRSADDASQRPDVVVQLPNGRAIVIDAKTPLDAYLSAMNTTDELQRTAFLQSHAVQVRAHLSSLADKKYWQKFHNSPDFVVCFLPSEVLFSAALEQDPGLIEFGSHANVILATPTTLIALLKAVAYGWQQMEITRNAIEICKAGDELYKKLAGTQEHFVKMGNALTSTVKHFNNLVGAVEGRGSVFSLASKLHQLGIGQQEIAELAPVELSTRALQSDHWDGTIALAAAEEVSGDSAK